MSDLTVAIIDMERHAPGYVRAYEYFRGTVPERFGSVRMRRALQASASAFRLNLAKTPVNVVADRLEIVAVTVPGQDALTAILQTEVWDVNELTFEFPGLIRKTCTYGDAYLLVWEGPDGEGVEVSYNSPLEGRMVYDPENSRRKLYYVHVWVEDGMRYADVYYADRVEQFWQDAKKDKPEDEAAWQMRVTQVREMTPEELAGEGHPLDAIIPTDVWPLENPYGEVPAFHFRTDRPWGVPLHLDAYGPQDAITKIIASHMSTVDYQTFPQRYALEEAGQETDELDEDDWDEVLDNTSLSATATPAGGLRAGSGEVWWLKGVKGVGQFATADPNVFLDPAQFYMRMMAQTTNVPLHFFDPGGDQPSGESRRAAESTLVKAVKTLSQSLGFTAGDALAFAMKVLAHGELHVDVRWSPFDSTEDKDSWETAGLKVANGVPVSQVLQEQGYTAEQVEEWTTTSDSQDLLRRVELLDKVGEAIQKLGAGVGFGVVTAEQVAGVIAQFLGDGAGNGGN